MVIAKLENIYRRFGILKKIVTDNGTVHISGIQKVCDEWNLIHVTSSPINPRSNRLAERNVQTIERLLTKAYEDSTA